MKTLKDIKLTKKEQERLIKNTLRIYGYSYGKEPMKIDKSFFDTGRVLLSVPSNSRVPKIEVFEMDKPSVEPIAMEFFDRFFTLHDVRTISNEEFSEIAVSYVSDDVKPTELLKLCDELEAASRFADPFDIPVLYIPQSGVMDGVVQKPMLLKNNDKYLRKQNIYFSNIKIGNNISTITPCSYIHEITHTQVESNKGSVRDYHNSEVLTILLELIAAYEMYSNKDTLSFMISVRLRDVLEKMALLYQGKSEYNTLLRYTIYLKSTLQALQLFDIYQNSSYNVRMMMVEGIQEVFDGKKVLEDFMMKFGVTFKSSSEPDFIKKLCRRI